MYIDTSIAAAVSIMMVGLVVGFMAENWRLRKERDEASNKGMKDLTSANPDSPFAQLDVATHEIQRLVQQGVERQTQLEMETERRQRAEAAEETLQTENAHMEKRAQDAEAARDEAVSRYEVVVKKLQAKKAEAEEAAHREHQVFVERNAALVENDRLADQLRQATQAYKDAEQRANEAADEADKYHVELSRVRALLPRLGSAVNEVRHLLTACEPAQGNAEEVAQAGKTTCSAGFLAVGVPWGGNG
jgi:chromosome segregation ATPase